VVDGGGLTVGLRRGDGEREEKIWGKNDLEKKNGYIEWMEIGFQNLIFFF
jgi:hypothetical protein